MAEQPFTLLYDASGAPVTTAFAPITGRPGQALNTTAQGGLVALGADSGGVARALKTDASGDLLVSPVNPAGGSLQVYSGQAPGTLANQYGNAVYGRMDSPTPSAWQPLNLDMVGSLNVHLKSKVTFRAIATGVTAAAGKSLLSLINNSSMVVRVNEIFVYVPPGGGSGALLGSSNQTYYPFICELRRISTLSGGSAITPVSGDTSDSLASGVLVYSGASVGATINTFWRGDAQLQSVTGVPFFTRNDYNEKTMVIRPGEGLTLTEISSGTINNAAGTGTTTASVDCILVFTQAPA